MPAATSVPIGDFDASPKAATGGAFAQTAVAPDDAAPATKPPLPPSLDASQSAGSNDADVLESPTVVAPIPAPAGASETPPVPSIPSAPPPTAENATDDFDEFTDASADATLTGTAMMSADPEPTSADVQDDDFGDFGQPQVSPPSDSGFGSSIAVPGDAAGGDAAGGDDDEFGDDFGGFAEAPNSTAAAHDDDFGDDDFGGFADATASGNKADDDDVSWPHPPLL